MPIPPPTAVPEKTVVCGAGGFIGSHLVKMGGMVRTVKWISDPANGPVTLTFDPIATSQASGVGGSSVASALLGLPLSAATNYIGGSRVNLTPFGFFVDDTYQAGRRLTLTLGLRWDQPSDFSEVNGNDTVFLPDQTSPLGSFVNPVTGQRQTVMGNVALVNSTEWPSKYEDNLHWNAFSPRLGVAYRITDRTVLRGGYGISYPPISLSQDGPNLSAVNAAQTSVSNTFQVQSGSPNSILTSVSNPLPFGINQPLRRNVDPSFFYGKLIVAKTPGDSLARVEQWNGAIEQQIGSDAVLTVAFVAGLVVGKRRRRDFCSGCTWELADGATSCEKCKGTVVGFVERYADRLDVLEKIDEKSARERSA